jgi:hypothetical protein
MQKGRDIDALGRIEGQHQFITKNRPTSVSYKKNYCGLQKFGL